MFEQESYDKATVRVESQPGELFSNYEIKNWEFSPLIYKIIAVSAVLNLAFLAAVSQTNVLTARGCDSPWVGRVCQVVDMTYVAALLFGTEREYADVAYERTELSPEDEITYIIVSSDKLEYPEGYFQLANPEQYVNNPSGMDTAGLIQPGYSPYTPLPNNDSDLLKIQPNPPVANPNAYQDDSSPLFKVEDGTSNAKTVRPRSPRDRKWPNANAGTKEPSETAVANNNTNQQVPPVTPPANADEAKPDENGIFINKRPLKDKAKETMAQVDAQQVKLDNPFKVVIVGTLGLAKDGKTVVLKNPKPMPVDKNIPNDPVMMKLAQDWILAVGDAGWLGYFEKLELKKKPSSKKVVITVEQNDKEFVASVQSELTSPNEANTMATALRNWITLGALAAKNDELEFLKAASTSTDGNNLILNIKFEKPVVQQMIQRKLAETKAAPAEPSSTAVNAATNSNASK